MCAVAAKHRPPDDPDTPVPATTQPSDPAAAAELIDRFLTQLQWVLVGINAGAAVATAANAPGTSPALNFITQTGIGLPVWAAAWLAVAVILIVGIAGYPVQEYAHGLAVILWGFLGSGAALGLLTATTSSPSASLLLCAVIAGMAALHTVALRFRRHLTSRRRRR